MSTEMYVIFRPLALLRAAAMALSLCQPLKKLGTHPEWLLGLEGPPHPWGVVGNPRAAVVAEGAFLRRCGCAWDSPAPARVTSAVVLVV